MGDLKIIPLSKEEWKGTPILMRYTTESYFDVEIEETPDAYHIDLVKKKFASPVSHYPEEYDYPDELYADHWEGAEAWGIVSDEIVSEENRRSVVCSKVTGQKLLACIECWPETWSNRLLVTELWVSDELHRQGIGTRLMNLIKEKAQKDGRRAIMLETQSCNVRAIAFYKSQGFRLMGIDTCNYGNLDVSRHEVRFNLVYFITPSVGRATVEDLPEILKLQYLAYQSEAALFGTQDIPPLKETLDEVEEEYRKGIILKMVDDDGRIIGSVRAHADDQTVYIGKLMVHPDCRGRGYGKKLLSEIERCYGNRRCELFTSTRSVDNIRLYEKMGYKIFREEAVTDELVFVYMEKK